MIVVVMPESTHAFTGPCRWFCNLRLSKMVLTKCVTIDAPSRALLQYGLVLWLPTSADCRFLLLTKHPSRYRVIADGTFASSIICQSAPSWVYNCVVWTTTHCGQLQLHTQNMSRRVRQYIHVSRLGLVIHGGPTDGEFGVIVVLSEDKERWIDISTGPQLSSFMSYSRRTQLKMPREHCTLWYSVKQLEIRTLITYNGRSLSLIEFLLI